MARSLNNVNASANSLTPAYIEKTRALAGTLRPYGIRVYLSVRWSAPMELDHLKDADPLDPAVKAWWQAKADEIYRAIPDFGGFLVKANSEGQPGPQDYHRSHADGANMIADVLKPHHGVVMWRAFVYANDPRDGPRQHGVPANSCRWMASFRDNVAVAGQERPAGFPAARTILAAVRGHAENAADAGGADHQGISGPADPSGLSGAAV